VWFEATLMCAREGVVVDRCVLLWGEGRWVLEVIHMLIHPLLPAAPPR